MIWFATAAIAVATAGAPAAAAPERAPTNPRLAIGLDEHVGTKVPRDLTFTDSTGNRVSLGSLFDGHRPVVLVLAYARCRMLCSVVLHGIADAIRPHAAAAGRDYLPVVVSLDPRESSLEGWHRQEKLLEEIHRPGQREIWPYLVGDDASIKALAHALGFRYAWDPDTQQYAHPAVLFVLTPDGRIAQYLRGVRFDGLDTAVARAAAGTLTLATASDLLGCFHFDPSLHRYGSSISLFLRLGASVVLGTLLCVVVGLTIWERRRRRRRR